jgi:hypothetical protein
VKTHNRWVYPQIPQGAEFGAGIENISERRKNDSTCRLKDNSPRRRFPPAIEQLFS